MNHSLLPGNKFFISFILILSFSSSSLLATHNLGGHIRAEHITGTTYKITLTTYSDPAPAGVDRCAVDIELWSIGQSPVLIQTIHDIPRRNGPLMTNLPSDCQINNPKNGTVLIGTVKKNIYDTLYTFPLPGTYEIRYSDIARHESIVNIDKPDELDFYVFSQFVIPGGNVTDNPPLFLNENIYEDVCKNQVWTHNPGGFDPDGDSLVYSLRACYQYNSSGQNTPVAIPGYLFPDDTTFGVSTLTMDSLTGVITWDSPQSLGVYALAYQVESFRNGLYLGKIVGETIVWVIDCTIPSPVLEVPEQLFITCGDTLTIPVLAYHSVPNDSLYLELNNAGLGYNGLFSGLPGNSPTFNGMLIDGQSGGIINFSTLPFSTQNSGSVPDTIQAEITWVPDCSEAGKSYQLDLWAHNNLGYSQPTLNQVMVGKYQSSRVTVLYPTPQNLVAQWDTVSGSIQLTWDPPAQFTPLSYQIYLSTDSLSIDKCQDISSLSQVGQVSGNGPLTFSITPQNLIEKDVCFYVTAFFTQNGGNESCLSNEACISNYTTSLEEEFANPSVPRDFQIYDMNGRIVLEGKTQGDMPNLGALPKGLYIIHIQGNKQKFVKKILNW